MRFANKLERYESDVDEITINEYLQVQIRSVVRSNSCFIRGARSNCLLFDCNESMTWLRLET